MGIKHLNKFLKANCSHSITKISLSSLYGKKIAIDANIYLYRFMSEGQLLENMYLMISILLSYKITPIFIFDGKSPVEKKLLISKRREIKKNAKKKYNDLLEKIKDNTDDYYKVKGTMNILRRKFVHINPQNISIVKQMMDAYGIMYIDADGEGEVLCAKLVAKKKVFACMSEDMDLFVYGCPNVLRYLSLINGTAVLYNMKGILLELGITKEEFKEICVISGTDYNFDTTKNTSLYKTLKLFKKFKKRGGTNFYDWLNSTTTYIKDYDKLHETLDMFDLTNVALNGIDRIYNNSINKQELHSIMESDGFVYI